MLWFELISSNTVDFTIGNPGLGGLGSTTLNVAGTPGEDAEDCIIVLPGGLVLRLGGGKAGQAGTGSVGNPGDGGLLNPPEVTGVILPHVVPSELFGDGLPGQQGRDDIWSPRSGERLLWIPPALRDPGSADIDAAADGGSAGGGGSSIYGPGGYGGGQDVNGGQGRDGQDGQGPGAGGGGGGPTGGSPGGTNAGNGGDGQPAEFEIFYYL
ncbi:MAG: hypothetical protein V2I66_08085 [Halieaceae bacterium]|jgi:hypothetical protein|nr:hypothetical protein [Halieaceae bacterium]